MALREIASCADSLKPTSQNSVMRVYHKMQGLCADRMFAALRRLIDKKHVIPTYNSHSHQRDTISAMRLSRAGYNRIGRDVPIWLVEDAG